MGSELRPRRRDRCHCRGLQTRPPRPRPTCGALPAGAVRAASLNGGRNACAPTSTIHRRRPCRACACNPTDTAFTRRRAIARDLHEKTPAAQDASSASGRQQQHPRTCHCTRSARENTSRSGCIFCIRAPATAPTLATSQRSSGGRSRSCGNGSSSGCECSASSKQQLSVCARPHTSQTCLGFQRSQAALVDLGSAWAIAKRRASDSSNQQLSVCARPHTPQTCLGFQRSQAALVDNGADGRPPSTK